MNKQDKAALSAALNIMLGTKGVTFEQMSGANMLKVKDALIALSNEMEVSTAKVEA